MKFVVAAALALLASLSPTQRNRAVIGFNDEERFDWHYVPRARRGLPAGDLSATQRKLLDDLLRAGLSEAGHRKVTGIVELEPILGRLEGSSFRDPARYHISIFGDPAKEPWGWRFEGHHLSVNATHTARGTSMTPMFLGANPARVPDGPRRGWEILGQEERMGRALFLSLDGAQRKRATISTRAPRDIVTGTGRTFTLGRYEGLPASAMSDAQRDQLLQLVMLYVGNAPDSVSDAEMASLRKTGIDRLHFAWAGGDRSGQPHYYRVHGPTILIEYDNTQDGANHIHTVWRSPDRDFGADLLARHYAEAHHHRNHRHAHRVSSETGRQHAHTHHGSARPHLPSGR